MVRCRDLEQPDDGHHDAPKHVVVTRPIASCIIKLVVVLTVVHLFTLYSHTTGMSNLEITLCVSQMRVICVFTSHRGVPRPMWDLRWTQLYCGFLP